DKRGKKMRGPGAVSVQVDKQKPSRVELSRTKMSDWKITDRPQWMATAETRQPFTLGPGTHKIILGPMRPAVLGCGLIAECAQRAQEQADSLRPVIVGLLIDEVLAQTISMDQPATADFRSEGAAYALSARATLRAPIAAGHHRVRLTLSDNAVLGVSMRPRFSA